jgi:hypothetical protein
MPCLPGYAAVKFIQLFPFPKCGNQSFVQTTLQAAAALMGLNEPKHKILNN